MANQVSKFETIYEVNIAELLEADRAKQALSPIEYAEYCLKLHLDARIMDSIAKFAGFLTLEVEEPIVKRKVGRSVLAGSAFGVHALIDQDLFSPLITPSKNELSLNPEDVTEELVKGIIDFLTRSADDEFDRHKHMSKLVMEWFRDGALEHSYVTIGFGLLMHAAKKSWESATPLQEIAFAFEEGLLDWDDLAKTLYH